MSWSGTVAQRSRSAPVRARVATGKREVRGTDRAARRGRRRPRLLGPAQWTWLALAVTLAAAAAIVAAASRPEAEVRRVEWPAAQLGRPADWRPYGASSAFNAAIPRRPRLMRNSTRIVKRLLGFDQIEPLWIGTADTRNDYGRPVYEASAGDPAYRLRCEGRYCPMPIEGERIRVPAGARPAGGSDGHMAIVQPN